MDNSRISFVEVLLKKMTQKKEKKQPKNLFLFLQKSKPYENGLKDAPVCLLLARA